MYKDKTTDELLIILSGVCTELESRCVGIADNGGKILPIIKQEGNTVTCLHVSSSLGVSVFRESMQHIKTVMLEKGQTLSGATSLSKFVKHARQEEQSQDGQEKL